VQIINIKRFQKRRRVSYNTPTSIVEKESLKENYNTLNFSFHFNHEFNFSFKNFIEKYFMLLLHIINATMFCTLGKNKKVWPKVK